MKKSAGVIAAAVLIVLPSTVGAFEMNEPDEGRDFQSDFTDQEDTNSFVDEESSLQGEERSRSSFFEGERQDHFNVWEERGESSGFEDFQLPDHIPGVEQEEAPSHQGVMNQAPEQSPQPGQGMSGGNDVSQQDPGGAELSGEGMDPQMMQMMLEMQQPGGAGMMGTDQQGQGMGMEGLMDDPAMMMP
ncbi:hypothetical protein B0H94_110111 [Salsuginibacillus halophilus]|uniref:Uncharacterized protein n=1 Tax=Salsuginibacillus halophilus TaxID=517424 RepID=A0A2P8HBN3_9BACI|nr:hypothetical protein [Salsuginibacillus halophilus]PSL43635.1 hypothetical protein B0H94_110111 [Salsuginibacillus halophilus]